MLVDWLAGLIGWGVSVVDGELQLGFVLHVRSYRETSMLVELLTQHAGRISVLAKGVKRAKSLAKGLLQPFVLLEVGWRGRGDLPTLYKVEASGAALLLQGTALFSGLYLNELLMRVLHRHDPCEQVFLAYKNTLDLLYQTEFSSAILRKFEKILLSELGYGLPLTYEAETDSAICEDRYYSYFPDRGFMLLEQETANLAANIFLGKHLLAIAADYYEEPEILAAAKRLMRFALAPLLGDKPLKTRELFS